ncbi:bifunctional transcriptional activator/DNA repair enzyme AdaA [Paenibacillus chartarius]|uniref:Bifunctional transcriptional activator/DNA repair enzyme AdaA n=1 Tax=Paenibacillus chartarius TaxID=747481 RepID=A0ABV6DL53_9BACL
MEITEKIWQAIVQCDPAYDGRFIYAVLTTGICCRPSCKSRAPKKENVRLFPDADQACRAGFRPCKRCRPCRQDSPMEEWIALIAEYIDNNFDKPLTLETLSNFAHSSPYHLLRSFKRLRGMTPGEYIQRTRINKAKELLTASDRKIADIGSTVGLPNPPHFITVFKKLTGCTPAGFRSSYRGEPRAAQRSAD